MSDPRFTDGLDYTAEYMPLKKGRDKYDNNYNSGSASLMKKDPASDPKDVVAGMEKYSQKRMHEESEAQMKKAGRKRVARKRQ